MPVARPRTPRLTEEKVLQAALELVETDGTAKFSMRKLAEKLDVTPMAIYRYFNNRAELLERLADNVLRGVKVLDGGPWQAQLLNNALSTWRILRNYPGLATYLLQRPMTPNARRHVKRLVDFLEEAGLDRKTAELAYRSYHAYVYGLVALEAQFHGPGDSDAKRERVVEFGIRTWVTGLESHLQTSNG